MPVHRLPDIPHIQRQLERQDYPNLRIYAVGNGPAEGRLAYSSGPHQSLAMNVGLEAARRDGCAFWLKMDADDIYLPGYVSEQVTALEQGPALVGKACGWMRLGDELLLRVAGPESAAAVTLAGHTLGGPLNGTHHFDSSEPYGEDARLCWSVRAAGGDLYSTSRNNACYVRVRDTGHTYPLYGDDLLTYSASRYFSAGDFCEEKMSSEKTRLVRRSHAKLTDAGFDWARNPSLAITS